nr:putative ribonuclease H-like domain-containing protein [Tanacetum cinerariifolium]
LYIKKEKEEKNLSMRLQNINTTQAQQKALDDALVAPVDCLEFEKCNMRLKIDIKPKEATFQVVSSIRFTINKKKVSLDVEIFREILQICPKILGQEFEDLPLEHDIHSFIRDLGHIEDITYLTDVNVDYLHQPRRAFATVINKCLSVKEIRMDKIHLLKTKMRRRQTRCHVPDSLRSSLITSCERINLFGGETRCFEKAPKPKYVRKKVDFDTSPKQKHVQATKGTRIKSKAKVAKSDKKKQPAKTPKAKGLVVLSEVTLTEAKQLKLATKRSKKYFHISHASGLGDGVDTQSKVPDEQQKKNSGTDEGTDSDEEDADENDFEDDADNIMMIVMSNEEHDDEEEYYDEFNIDDEEMMYDDEDDQVTKELYEDVNSGFEQEEKDAHVTLTPVLEIQKTGGPTQSSFISSDFTSKLLNLDNPSPNDITIASLMDTIVYHEITSTTTIPPPPPLFNTLQQQAIAILTPTALETITSLPAHLDFASVFKFNERVTNLESFVRDKATILDVAIPVIKKNVIESLEATVLTRSSSQSQSSYEAAAILSEFKLTKIRIDNQYENFIASSSEVLDQTFDRLQKLISQLEIHGESISQEDVNQKFLRSLSPKWNTHYIVWRNKPDIDTLSLDDLYNNLKIYEPEVKGISSSILNIQNVAFMSSNNTKSTNGGVNTAHGVTTANTQATDVNSITIDNLSDDVIYSFFANGYANNESKKILKEHWKEVYYEWECRAPRNQENKNRESTRRIVPVETLASSALVSCDRLRGNFLPPKPNFSGLEEFVNEYIVNEPTVKKPADETSEAKSSTDKPKDEKGVIDSGFSRHMTWNLSDLTDYEEINGGYVSFGGNPKRGKITGKVPRKNNMYSVDLKNIVSKGGLTCLFAKATSDESKLWHRRLGDLNFKTMNKLVKGNLVRGIENLVDHKVKVIRCENETEFKNREINQFCEMKGNQSNGNAGTKACDNAESKSSQDDEFQPLSDNENKVDEDLREESECHDQEKLDNVNSTNNVNAAGINIVSIVGTNTSNELLFDQKMHELEDINTFNISNEDEDNGAEADMNNLDTAIQVSPTPTTRIYKDHPLDQVIGDLYSNTQTGNMSKNLEEHGFVTTIHQRTNHKDLQNCLFACFLSQEEPKKTLMDLPYGKRVLGTKWVFRNKKDERGIVIRNKARLVTQGHTQEEGIDYDEVFAPVARIEAIRLFLAYDSFKDFVVYQMDVKSDFLYEKIKENVYVCQPSGLEDPDVPDKVYKVEKALYGLHQDPRAWVNPTIYTSCIDQFLATAKVKNINGEAQLHVNVDGKKVVIFEASIMRDLQFGDEGGVDCLPNEVIFEHLTLMGAKTTAWNEFCSTIASVVICLATIQKFNFSKYIFENMVKNLDSVTEFLMYPRYVSWKKTEDYMKN